MQWREEKKKQYSTRLICEKYGGWLAGSSGVARLPTLLLQTDWRRGGWRNGGRLTIPIPAILLPII